MPFAATSSILKGTGIHQSKYHFIKKETKMINVFRKTVLLLLAFSFTLYLGCSSDDSDVNPANQLLEKAYQSYMDGDPSQALIDVNASLVYAPTPDALIFKSQVEYALTTKRHRMKHCLHLMHCIQIMDRMISSGHTYFQRTPETATRY